MGIFHELSSMTVLIGSFTWCIDWYFVMSAFDFNVTVYIAIKVIECFVLSEHNVWHVHAQWWWEHAVESSGYIQQHYIWLSLRPHDLWPLLTPGDMPEPMNRLREQLQWSNRLNQLLFYTEVWIPFPFLIPFQFQFPPLSHPLALPVALPYG